MTDEGNPILGGVALILIIFAILFAAALNTPQTDTESYSSSFTVDNETDYNVTVEVYVVALDNNASLNADNATGGWDYLKFNVSTGEQITTTVRWFGGGTTVTVFAVYYFEMDGSGHFDVNRYMVNEDENFIDILVE